MFDLLSGALSEVEEAPKLSRVPLSFARAWVRRSRRKLTPSEIDAARGLLASVGITPYDVARRSRPVTFVDVAYTGGTFTDLYALIREWVDDDRAQWDVIRTKIRFIGATPRKKTSPNTIRWAQQNPWTGELPGRSVLSVSLDPHIWSYLGDHQPKLTRSYAPSLWLADTDGPDRSERTRVALAEAVALVAYGRSPTGRHLIAEAMDGEPALAHAWLRTLRTRLRT